jgi:hypothetical protein
VTGLSTRRTAAELVGYKAHLLSEGVVPTSRFLDHYGPPHLLKRRAYGNPDDLSFLDVQLPQEIVLSPGRVVCSVAVRLGSRWSLDWTEDLHYVLCHEGRGIRQPVDFPLQPAFYDRTLANGKPVNSIITLYGSGSLGIFAYGNCALVDIDKACKYCSIQPNRERQHEFEFAISAAQVEEALDIALVDPIVTASQVMINGGNLPDVDRSFRYYAGLVRAARRAIDRSGRQVELHLIVYPPNDHSLIDELAGLDVHVAMNCEVFDPELFSRYCPGKIVYGGQRHLWSGLRAASERLGRGRVYTICVGGLEPLDSLSRGMRFAAGELGAIPVVNVFHADPQTPLATHREPTADEILAMGRELQRIYRDHPFCRPFYAGVGRNALDGEAALGLFDD